MCQVNEDYHERMKRCDAPRASTSCVKCKEGRAVVVVRVGDPYCRVCFKEYFTHKFRAMLGKTRIVFPGEKVLLAVSGGPSSSSMLALVQEGLSQNAHKKLRFSAGIVYVDEGGAVGQSMEERRRAGALLHAVFKPTGFPFHIVPLEQVLDLPSSVLVEATPPPSHREGGAYKAAVHHFLQSDASRCVTSPDQETEAVPSVEESHTRTLQQLISSAHTLTARDDLLATLRQHLLVHKARSEGYSKLMMGDSCTRLAVKLLTSIALGRGAQLAQDTGFCDSRYGDIVSVRPMRDYTAKEVAFYNHLFNVASVATPTLDTKTCDKASIQRLTESFITNLQEHFPSTVSTIYRTSEKLQTACRSRSSSDQQRETCLLCLSTVDAVTEEASASQATRISQELSGLKLHQAPPTAVTSPPQQIAERTASSASCSDGGCGTATSGCCSSDQVAVLTDFSELLCYSCQRTLKDLSSVKCLPPYILSEAQQRIRRSQLKQQISDFLLDDAQ